MMQVHNAVASFRVNGALLARAQQKAQQEGMSLPELFRHALRREVKDAA